MSPAKDRRGRHTNRPHATSQEVLTKMNEFMYDVITKRGSPSHYGGRYARDAILLPSTLNVSLLWELFHLIYDKREPSYMELVEKKRDDPDVEICIEPIIKREWFSKYLNHNYGQVRFWRGKTDQCGTCMKLETKITSLKQDLESDDCRDRQLVQECLELVR